MAVIAISNTGGNWNSVGTWVGGVIPTTSDSISATATSGQLTVNVNATILSFDFTNYVNTLTINSNITLTTASTGTSTFASGMSFSFLGSGSSQGRIAKGAGAQTYTQNGTTQIPHFALTSTTGALTLGSNLHITNYRPTVSQSINGNTMFIYSAIDTGFTTIRGTTIFRFVGTGSINVLSTGSANEPFEFIIDCSGGTATISSPGIGIGNVVSNSNITFRHLSGTIVNPTFRPNLNGGTSVHTFDLLSGTTWDCYSINNVSTTTIAFTNPTYFDKFIFTSTSYLGTNLITISGNTLNVNDFSYVAGFNNSSGTYFQLGIDFIIATGTTMNVNNSFDFNGGNNEPTPSQTPNFEIKSSIPGTQANLNVNTYNQYISRARFTDINCSGGNTLYGQNLTLSNTTKISQYTLPPSGGGGGQTSYTFFS